MTTRNFILRTTRLMCLIMCLVCASVANAATANWWANDTLVVKGCGFPPRNADPKYARDLARRAAVADGYRNLAERVKEIHITAETTVGTQILAGDIVRSKVNALIRDAEILSTDFDADGKCVVVMSVPIYGVTNSVASVTLKPVDKQDFPKPPADLQAEGHYTGLIIDCGDSDLKPVLTPVIRDADNVSIYSYGNLDFDKVLTRGMIGYVTKDDDTTWLVQSPRAPSFVLLSYAARIENKLMFLTAQSTNGNKSRVGANPLIIRAERLADDDTSPVVSKSDADKILAENQISHFLDNGAVVFTGYRVGGLRV